jgi:hypothetical protein
MDGSACEQSGASPVRQRFGAVNNAISVREQLELAEKLAVTSTEAPFETSPTSVTL